MSYIEKARVNKENAEKAGQLDQLLRDVERQQEQAAIRAETEDQVMSHASALLQEQEMRHMDELRKWTRSNFYG